MKSSSRKGLPGAKTFTTYSGNVKGKTGSVPNGTRKSPAGGSVKSSIGKKASPKKLGR